MTISIRAITKDGQALSLFDREPEELADSCRGLSLLNMTITINAHKHSHEKMDPEAVKQMLDVVKECFCW